MKRASLTIFTVTFVAIAFGTAISAQDHTSVKTRYSLLGTAPLAPDQRVRLAASQPASPGAGSQERSSPAAEPSPAELAQCPQSVQVI